ncbi:MAG: 50S ribosomal protein L23 [Candidatus Omnitrophica bacterium]|nr:50S ribosomal protein L23 [Candidatus Omnitrophota bacterium]
MSRNSYDVVKTLIRTEKSSNLLVLNKYLFWVAKDTNKIEIKKAINDIYKVAPTKVNIIPVRGKRKRLRYHEGRTSDWKKALVTLKSGDKIEIQ